MPPCTVLDSMVAITTVLPDGHRYPLLARVGTKLSEALAASQNGAVAASAALLSPKYGYEAHVRVAHDVPLAPRDEDEDRQLELLAEDIRPDSRLARCVQLVGSPQQQRGEMARHVGSEAARGVPDPWGSAQSLPFFPSHSPAPARSAAPSC